MHRNARRLVHDQQGIIFKNDAQLSGRGGSLALLLCRNPDGRDSKLVAQFQPVCGVDPPTVDPHLAAAQDAVNMAARDAFAVTDQEIVNALAGSFLPTSVTTADTLLNSFILLIMSSQFRIARQRPLNGSSARTANTSPSGALRKHPADSASG